MSETGQQTVEKFIHVACNSLNDNALAVCFFPWSENSPYSIVPGKALAAAPGGNTINEDELSLAMQGKTTIVAGCMFEELAEEEAATQAMKKFLNYKGVCVLIAHILRDGMYNLPGSEAQVMARHDRMLATGAHDVLMDPSLDDEQELNHAVNMAVTSWHVNTHRMDLMLSNEVAPVDESYIAALQKQHQTLLWDNIPRALMPQLRLARNIPGESADGVGNYVFGERFRTVSGTVTRATDTTKNNELVAIKIVDKSKIFAPGELEGIYRELRFLTDVFKHPNIGHCSDHLHTMHFLYIVLDFAGDENLATLLKNKIGARFERRSEALQCFKDITSGLAHCHSKGAAHRNLTCEHVVMQAKPDGSHHCTIIDFRRAMVAKETSSTAKVGTMPYVAPEALEGPYMPLVADCWSLGIVLLEVTGGLGSTFAATRIKEGSASSDFRQALVRFFMQDGAHNKALTTLGAASDPEICQYLETLLELQEDRRGTMPLILQMLPKDE